MRRILTAFFLFTLLGGNAQSLQRPKLVVGIVVDQMRPDYLTRIYDRFGEGGFKRLMNGGFRCENAFIPYVPTYTACGHTCVYTGSVPALHGIVGNTWYDKELKRDVYCTEDNNDTIKTVGSNSVNGRMSPRNMFATTVGDELRLSNNFRSKVIGIAIKDRGAILPAGQTANAAYWFDVSTGTWITSTYYMKTLPQWMQQLNSKKLPDAYLSKPWNTLYPLNTYVQSTGDNKVYESILSGEGSTFPHRVDTVKNAKYQSFEVTPYGNSFTVDAAKAAIDGEALGTRGVTDFLAVSFSSTDYIGHAFGPNSIEIEDTYLRLDKDLADLFNYLDTKVGKGQYLLFLTADHAVAHVPGFARENKLPGGVSNTAAMRRALNDALQKEFGVANLVASVINYQVHINAEALAANKLDKEAVKRSLIKTLLAQPGVLRALDLESIPAAGLPQQVANMLANGYNQKLSGDVQFIYKPGWFEGTDRGTTHGSWNPYDSHIPLLWYGWNVTPGKTNREVYMTDIAPTVSALLQIQMPSASIGKVITELTNASTK